MWWSGTVPYVNRLRAQFRRVPERGNISFSFKGEHTLKSFLMHPCDLIPIHLKHDFIYTQSCPIDNCNATYIGESGGCLEAWVKDHFKVQK